MPQVSIREYAKLRGVSHTAVQKAISSGRLVASVTGVGTKTVRIDVASADAEWPKSAREVMNDAFQPDAPAERSAPAPAPAAPASPPNEMSKTTATYQQSRAVREAYAARLAKLEYERRSGKLVDADEVEKKWTEIASLVRTRVLGIASKAKQRMPGLTVAQYQALDAIVVDALESLQGKADPDLEDVDAEAD